MNVENRKLFANRDARKRLAEMGGILASSPELMGEAMKFANGGTARERAISGQGALDQFASSGMQPLDFSLQDLDRDLGSKMQALDDRVQGRIVSFLGSLFEVVGNRIFHTESGVEIEEPNLKTEILTQGERVAEEDMAMAQPVPQGQPRVFAQPEVMLPEAKPEVMFPGELSRPFVPQKDAEPEGRANPYVQAMIDAGLSEDPVTFDPQGLMSPPMYDVSRLAAPKIDDRSGLERLDAELEADPENIKAKVVRLGQSGKRAAEIANALGRPIQEILDIGLGLAAQGTVEVGALAADLIAVVQGAVVNNPESAEFYAGIAQNLKKFGDESYYGEGDILPRISNTDLLRGDLGPSEAEQLAQQREQIRKDSLAATLDGDDSLFAEGAPVEFLPEGATAAFPRTTSVTSVEGSMTAPGMAQSDLPEINVTPSPIRTMSGPGLTLPPPPQGRVGDMPIDELIDFRSPEVALGSENLLKFRTNASAIENEMDKVLDPIVPFNTVGGKATALGEETQSQTETLDALVEESPLQKDAQTVIDEAAGKTDVTPDPSQGDDIAPSVVEDIVREPQGPETVRPKTRPGGLEVIKDAEAIASNIDSTPEQKSNELANATLSGVTGEKLDLGPKESVAAYQKYFSDLLGVKDKDKEKEMWHNMAMIGFAIAAGESPNALANIANGMLAGTKMMKEDRASEQARKDEIAQLSIAEANADRRLDARLRSAERIAGMRSSGTGSFATPDRMFKSVLDNTMSALSAQVEDGTMTIEDANRSAFEAASKAFPESQFARTYTDDTVDPKKSQVSALIQTLKTDGVSDEKIKSQLIEAGHDPKTYGLI